MVGPYFLPCLLLLPLGNCFPLPGREAPVDATGTAGEVSWADPAGVHPAHPQWGSSQWPSAPRPRALLVTAKELRMSRRAHTGFRFRFRKRDDGGGADGAEKASRPLGTLAEELSGYSRKKGGFSFRFGRR